MTSEVISILKGLLIIPKCKCCAKPGDRDNLCDKCRAELAKRRIPADKRPVKKRFELVDKAYGSYYYKGRAADGLKRAKFTNPASFLASLLTDISIDIDRILSENNIDVITSIPAHKSKFYTQEFDLPLEMAKRISRHTGVPFVQTGIKVKKTERQHNLPLDKRKANLVNAFEINRDVKNKNILIIEDVITTGNTISAYATELKLAGAGKVYAWAYTYNTYE